MKTKREVAVLGAGSWGTALAYHLARAGQNVRLWSRDHEILQGIAQRRANPKHLSDIPFDYAVHASSELGAILRDVGVVVVAVPSAAVREVAVAAAPLIPAGAIVISTSKGLEQGSLRPMSEVLVSTLNGRNPVAVLSGPSFAREVMEGRPTAVTVAAKELEVARDAAAVFHYENFRVYTSSDVVGVELGGVVKNVIALACGIVDGVAMGANARAALITRGLNEMQRLVVAVGGEAMTVAGLSGLGDLLLTATGDLSRNRQVGLRLGRGEKLEEVIAALGEVAEGVRATANVLELARRHKVPVPITEQVNRMLQGECSAHDAAYALLSRTPGTEIKLAQ